MMSMLLRTDGRISVVTSCRKVLRSIRLDLELLGAREGQQLLVMPGAALRRVANAVEHPLQPLLVVRIAHREVAGAEDGGQQIVEVVGQPAGKLAERLHLLRLEQLLARFLQPQLGFAPLGHVAGDLGEADQLAVIVADGVDHHAGPEAACRPCARASLPPRSGRFARGRQRALGHAGVEVLGRVETAKCSPTISSGV